MTDLSNNKNHRTDQAEELEEQLFMIHQLAGDLMGGFLFPVLSLDTKFCEESLKFKDYHFEYVKKCMARIIYFRGSNEKTVYVGCPVSFTADMHMLRKHFPYAKFIVSVRDPRKSWPSMIDFITSVT